MSHHKVLYFKKIFFERQENNDSLQSVIFVLWGMLSKHVWSCNYDSLTVFFKIVSGDLEETNKWKKQGSLQLMVMCVM